MADPPRHLFVLGSFVMACCAGVDRLPRAGESLVAQSFSAEPGGKGFNVAVGIRRLGAAVDCMIAVGDDMFGQLAVAALGTAGLSPRFLLRSRTPTGSGIGFIDASGENCLAVFPGANLSLSAADVTAAAAAIETAAMVLAQFEIGDPPIAAAFALARAAGRTTLLNPSPFRRLRPDILAATTILVVNETEACALAESFGLPGAEDRAGVTADWAGLAARLHAQGVETVIVTLGSRGAQAYARDRPPLHQPAFVVESVDTLGAGDAFLAALAVGLLNGSDMTHALRRAAAAGALMASRAGTLNAFPDAAAIDRCIDHAVRQRSDATPVGCTS